eukprot:6970836-Pyramimonas_sp.AAC.1
MRSARRSTALRGPMGGPPTASVAAATCAQRHPARRFAALYGAPPEARVAVIKCAPRHPARRSLAPWGAPPNAPLAAIARVFSRARLRATSQ